MIVVEELYVSDRREVADALKPLITDERIEIQAKGADQITTDNRANFIMSTNHQDAMRKTKDDRRYAIFFCAQQAVEDIERDGLGGDYFPRFYQWLKNGGYADVAGWLDRYEIPDHLNPATNCHRAPRTSTTDQAVMASLGMIEQEIMGAISEERVGFIGGWVSSVAITRLLADIRKVISPRNRRSMMATLGYYPHPALNNGQASTKIINEDMKRPVLYVKRGSLAENFQTPREATDNYINAQGYGVHDIKAG